MATVTKTTTRIKYTLEMSEEEAKDVMASLDRDGKYEGPAFNVYMALQEKGL